MRHLILLAVLVSCCNTLSAQKKTDLILEKIEEPQWDDSTRIFVWVKNKSNKDLKNIKLRVWDVDATLEEAKKLGAKQGDYWIFEENVSRAENGEKDYDTDFDITKEIPLIKSGESMKVEVNVKHWIYDSNCEIGAMIDSNKEVKEKNEENNTKYFFAGG